MHLGQLEDARVPCGLSTSLVNQSPDEAWPPGQTLDKKDLGLSS